MNRNTRFYRKEIVLYKAKKDLICKSEGVHDEELKKTYEILYEPLMHQKWRSEKPRAAAHTHKYLYGMRLWIHLSNTIYEYII